MDTWIGLWRETLDVLIPQRCVGCGLPGESVCEACLPGLDSRPMAPELAIRRELFGVPILSAWHYSGVRRDVVLAYKDKGVMSLAPHIVSALRDTLAHLRPHLADPSLCLIPVPSSFEGWLARGREPVVELAKRLASDATIEVAPLLHRADRGRMLREWGTGPIARKTRSRRSRMADPPRFIVRGGLQLPPPAHSVVLLDDVVTTGATLESAAGALATAGCPVSAVLTLAGVAGAFLGNPQVTGQEPRATLEKSHGMRRRIP